MRNFLFPGNEQFWFETVRQLGHASYGGSDVAEVLTCATRISSGDYDSWYAEWNALAVRLQREAEGQLAAGHEVSARDAFQRAGTYFRAAEFFLHGDPDDPRIDRAYFASVDCFRSWAKLSGLSITPVEIPYEGKVLHGYWYAPATKGPWPVVIMHSGFDGTVEEMHFNGAMAAYERGYAVLSFDGPGQPAARHRDGLLFRPDWEKVVGPVVDFVLARPNVDGARIALLGLSLGGLLAPRAAAFEHRLAACIAVDGVYAFGANAAVEKGGGETMRWAAAQAAYTMGVRSREEFAEVAARYSLAGGIAERIACPTLVCEAEDDLFFAGQPQALFDHLTCEKTLLKFTNAEGAGAHCHPGAQRLAYARIYDWLDDTLAV